MSSFTGLLGDESRLTSANRPLDDDGYTAYDPRLPSQRFDSFTDFVKNSGGNSPPIFTSQQSYDASDEAFSPQTMSGTPPSTYSTRGGRYSFSPKRDGDGGFGLSDRPMILPPEPAEMQTEEGFALREWRRKNAIRLEEKEKKEKEMLQLIIGEAEDYKKEFCRKRQLTLENKAAANREKEKQTRKSSTRRAEKNYWKAIAELIPHEVPVIEKRGKKKNEDKKKPSLVVIQGPEPGKPTDLLRMRQILVKLRHNPPPHMKPKPPPPPPPAAATAEAASSANAEAASAPEVIAAA